MSMGPDLELFETLGHRAHDLVINRVLHQQSRARGAGLTRGLDDSVQTL